MTHPPVTHPLRRFAAVAMAGLVLATGACSTGSDTRAATKSEAGASSAATKSTTKDGTSSVDATGDANVIASTVGKLRAGPNGEDTLVPLRLDITNMKRLSGNTVQVRLTLTNTDDTTTFEPYKEFSGDLFEQNVGALTLLDRPGDKKYLSLYDTKDKCLCSSVEEVELAPGDTSPTLYVDITAPPRSVTKVAVAMPGFLPIEDLEIQ